VILVFLLMALFAVLLALVAAAVLVYQVYFCEGE
jgi:hypothetical protein